MEEVFALYRIVDESIRKIIDVDAAPCKAGCNWCCYLPVDCCLEEAHLIDRAVKLLDRGTRKRLKKQWNHWFRVHGDKSSIRSIRMEAVSIISRGEEKDPVKAQMRINELSAALTKSNNEHVARAHKKKAPCPYLLDGLCAVYEVRPTVCRDCYPPPGFVPDDCKGPDNAFSKIEFEWLGRLGDHLGVNVWNQGRLPYQVKRAREVLKSEATLKGM